MTIKIALAGNPNSGKTTLFNGLTGSNQYVGNWPGVTVEKKEGRLKGNNEVIIQDLPGIYSLSPYTLEEVITRNYLVGEKPDAILNIVDGTNIERNLYLTTQLIELGLPIIVAVNMIDVVRKTGDKINLTKLQEALGCVVVEMSALKGEGTIAAAEKVVQFVKDSAVCSLPGIFTGSVEHTIAHIEETIAGLVDERYIRWYAIKVFERDEKALVELNLYNERKALIEEHISKCEKKLDDDSESIITNQRYEYIGKVINAAVKKKAPKHSLSVSDKIDRVVTNRVLALPIFALMMFIVYYISITTVGTWVTDWTNDTLFAETIAPAVSAFLAGIGCAPWLAGLIVNGIIAGVGAVLGFLPQLLVLFYMLAILEDLGYMARIAFIMDRIFRRFGLSGKSFIPMLIASGCAIPGIMASRTIENERDRRMTRMTTAFIPCGAKMPIVALFAGALFGGSSLVATSAYFIGIAAVIISGVILKKTKAFSGDLAPFVMELPQYHAPAASNVLHATWERGWSFIKRAGTVILASAIVLWFLQAFGVENGALQMVEDNNVSLLAAIGGAVAGVFTPLGFGDWQSTVATITGLIAKENVVNTFGVLFHVGGEANENAPALWSAVAVHYTALSAYSFMIFNLLCAPCFAAIGTIRREMNNAKWTWAAIGYMTVFAYVISLIVYQFGMLFSGGGFGLGTAFAIIALVVLLYLLFRKNAYDKTEVLAVSSVAASAKQGGFL